MLLEKKIVAAKIRIMDTQLMGIGINLPKKDTGTTKNCSLEIRRFNLRNS